MRWTAHWPRRQTLLLTLMCLTASQAISAVASTFSMLAAGRVLCAITHGLMLSVLARSLPGWSRPVMPDAPRRWSTSASAWPSSSAAR
ncbi:conserved integral membrane domain protein [Mycobacterium xenopi 4042]|uniref:Conserved integral membrane domain protein n=1 Tax=Mycobacterium xenopi 4042 TaxID=1299334 RepID=X8BJ96_MYCXE|nr:conserved integral membrane domain protein [Mycobacterium xenopi 4042]